MLSLPIFTRWTHTLTRNGPSNPCTLLLFTRRQSGISGPWFDHPSSQTGIQGSSVPAQSQKASQFGLKERRGEWQSSPRWRDYLNDYSLADMAKDSTRNLNDPNRYWLHSSDLPFPSQERFVLMSYNVLSTFNAHKQHTLLYRHIPKYLLDWEYRKQLIMMEVEFHSPDVICLQEVDKYEDLRKELEHRGYEGVYMERTGEAKEGCATFWRKKRFSLLEEQNIAFRDFGLRDNVAQFCVLQLNGESKPDITIKDGNCGEAARSDMHVIVGNIHVLFNPKRGDIKLGQVRLFLERAHLLSSAWNGAPVVLGGDFNSTPTSAVYKFLATAELDVSGMDRKFLSGQVTDMEPSRQGWWKTARTSNSSGAPVSSMDDIGNGQLSENMGLQSGKTYIGTSPSIGLGVGYVSSCGADSSEIKRGVDTSSEEFTMSVQSEKAQHSGKEMSEASPSLGSSINTPLSDGVGKLDLNTEENNSFKVMIVQKENHGSAVITSLQCGESEDGVSATFDESVVIESGVVTSLCGFEGKSNNKALGGYNSESLCMQTLSSCSPVKSVTNDPQESSSCGDPESRNGRQMFSTLDMLTPMERDPVVESVVAACSFQATEVFAGDDKCNERENGNTLPVEAATQILETEGPISHKGADTALTEKCSAVTESKQEESKLIHGHATDVEHVPAHDESSCNNMNMLSSCSESKEETTLKEIDIEMCVYPWSREELELATGSGNCTTVRHNLNLRSVYADVQGPSASRGVNQEPVVTCYNRKYQGTVDYLWYSEGLKPARVLDVLPIHVFGPTRGLPSKRWGSDHLALVCELVFTRSSFCSAMREGGN